MDNIGLLLIYVVGFIAIFYFLAVRPQQKQRKSHEQLINSVKRGDRVVTIGGIFGTVKRVEEAVIVVEIDKGVSVRVARRAIAEIATAEQKGKASAVLDKPLEDEAEAAVETEAEVAADAITGEAADQEAVAPAEEYKPPK